jgi:hypothetical protein
MARVELSSSSLPVDDADADAEDDDDADEEKESQRPTGRFLWRTVSLFNMAVLFFNLRTTCTTQASFLAL